MVKGMLSDEERAWIREAVARAEARTGAQIVVTVADSCGSYRVFAGLWAALAALLVGAIAMLSAPWLGAVQVILVEAVVFVAGALMLALTPLLMRVVPQEVRRAHARLIAEQQFIARVGARTEGGIGLLLFVALAERQIFILPDTGIAAAIEAARWNEIAEGLAGSARSGALAPGIVAAVEAMANVLEPKFPAETPPENPLSDEVVELGKAPNRE
jgi:uncharacterized membrane protein